MSLAFARFKRLDTRLERPLLWSFLVAAVLVGLASLVTGVLRLAEALSSGHIPLHLLIGGSLPSAADAGTADLVQGTYASASVLVSGLSPLPVFLWALSGVLVTLTTAVISAAVAQLCWKLLRLRAFDRSVSQMANLVGFVLVVGSLISEGFGGLGRMIATDELGAGNVWTAGFVINFAPMMAGFVILLVALAFEAGTRLQRDNEGLI